MEHEEVWAGSDAHFPSLHACGFSFRLNSPRTAPPYKDLLCTAAGFPQSTLSHGFPVKIQLILSVSVSSKSQNIVH